MYDFVGRKFLSVTLGTFTGRDVISTNFLLWWTINLGLLALICISRGCCRDFKSDSTTRRQRERRLKSEFAFFCSLSQLFLPTYFVKCRRTLLELNSLGLYPSTERAIKFRPSLLTSSIKLEIRHCYVVVVQKRAKKCTKSVMHVQSCCFAFETYCFFLRSRCCLRRWILKSLITNTFWHSFFLTNSSRNCKLRTGDAFCWYVVRKTSLCSPWITVSSKITMSAIASYMDYIHIV